ncbi:MAG: hypothetical protein COC04_02060, partial [Gammaproteobacteria bacterium]
MTSNNKEESSMRRMVNLGSIIVVSLVMSMSLTGCGTLTRDKALTDDEIILGQEGRTLWEAGLQYVKIVDRDKPGIANEHPESITSDELRTVLSSLYVSETVLFSETQAPVFTPTELQVLSATIPNGLSQAGPEEDITFVSIALHKGTITRERKTTTGRVFMSGGRLNIVFGKIHEIYRDKDPITQQTIDRRLHPLLPGSRKFDSNPSIPIALDEGQAHYVDPETGKERSDWIIIDIATVLAIAKERGSGDD